MEDNTFKIYGDVQAGLLQVERKREREKKSCSIKLHYYDNETLSMLL